MEDISALAGAGALAAVAGISVQVLKSQLGWCGLRVVGTALALCLLYSLAYAYGYELHGAGLNSEHAGVVVARALAGWLLAMGGHGLYKAGAQESARPAEGKESGSDG